MQLIHESGGLKVYGEKVDDLISMKYTMEDWEAIVFQKEDRDYVQIDGFEGLQHVRPEHVDATIAADFLAFAKNKAGLSDEECIIGNNGAKVRVWTKKGTFEALGTGFPLHEALYLMR